jgi:hypothetical protein
MKAISASFWLLTVCFGNFFVVAVEGALEGQDWVTGKNKPNKYFFYSAVCLATNLLFIFMARTYKYRSGTTMSAAG